MGKRYLYSIEIKPSNGKTAENYSVFFSKNYGDMAGGTRCCENIECLKELLKNIVRWWGEYDFFLNRVPDKVARPNLHFESFTLNISISDALGIQTLNNWI
ncbi:hypothetical protein D1BOALGB6SA_6939 [Olavius sp. associated proteobacterium Delta 1]|nr:hypothetical protein D1BOALGB6SA_6939 [Olavius sp. associated proteobacterium Delta 1]